MSNISRINSMRMAGLVSGLDIDSMVKKMLMNHQSKLDKVKQQKALLNWQKDAYRSVINTMTDFQGKFLDVLSPTNMMRASNFKTTAVSVPESMSQYFKATATSSGLNSAVTVNSITQLATAQTISTAGAQQISKSLTMTVSQSGPNNILGQSISFTLNGETKNVTLSNNIEDYYADVVKDENGKVISRGELKIGDFVRDINEKLDREFGKQGGQAKISINADSIVEGPPTAAGAQYGLSFDIAPNNTVQVSGSTEVRTALGLTGNEQNYINLDHAIGNVFPAVSTSAGDAKIRFSINDVVFAFDKNASIRDVMNEVNKSAAGVNMSYSSFSDSFTLTAKVTGSGDNIKLSETVDVKNSNGTTSTYETDFLSMMFGKYTNGTIGDETPGKDAVLTVNGSEIVRSSNTVNIDGVTLELLKATPEDFNNTEAISVKVDAQPVVDMIKTFITEYNSLIEKLSGLLSEKKARAGGDKGAYYLPLTDDQKAAMSDKEVELWDEMGKKGLLNNDPTISKMLTSIRTAMSSMVETGNGNVSLSSIGIKPMSYFDDKLGRLTVDEEALRKAIENDPDSVMNLFTQQSAIPKNAKMDDYFQKDSNGLYYMLDDNGFKKYMSESDLIKMRDSGTGLAQRFSDILYKNINVTMDEKERGALILKVGTGGSNVIIDRESAIDKRLSAMEKTIATIQSKLYAAEAKYYKQFAAMETAMAKLNKQSSILGLDSGGQ